MVFGFGVDMFGLELGKHLQNKQTEVTRQTNQYVTTQQQLLLTYAKEYSAAEADGNTGQMAAIVNQIQSVSATLDPEDVPAPAAQILAKEGF
jgi:hypothetical protein